FYDGYDPAFGYWISEPYKLTDKALQDYVALLRSKVDEPAKTDAKTEATKTVAAPPAAPARGTPSVTVGSAEKVAVASTSSYTRKPQETDVPDLVQLLAFPQSEFQAVIQKYQAGRSAVGGRFSTMATPPVD